MPTLYVENVPEDLYGALRKRARSNRTSISVEVLSLLKESLPTEEEMARRREVLARVIRIRSRRPLSSGPYPTTEEMQREDRLR